MTKRQQQMLQNLKQFADGSFDWCYGSVDFDAIKFVLSEVERLTTENTETLFEIRRLKNKCNSLWKAINQSTPEHYPSKDDLTWEVIE